MAVRNAAPGKGRGSILQRIPLLVVCRSIFSVLAMAGLCFARTHAPREGWSNLPLQFTYTQKPRGNQPLPESSWWLEQKIQHLLKIKNKPLSSCLWMWDHSLVLCSAQRLLCLEHTGESVWCCRLWGWGVQYSVWVSPCIFYFLTIFAEECSEEYQKAVHIHSYHCINYQAVHTYTINSGEDW